MIIKRPRLDDITSLLATLNVPSTIYLSTMIDGSWQYNTHPSETSIKIEIKTNSRKHLRKIVKRALDELEARHNGIKRQQPGKSRSRSDEDIGPD